MVENCLEVDGGSRCADYSTQKFESILYNLYNPRMYTNLFQIFELNNLHILARYLLPSRFRPFLRRVDKNNVIFGTYISIRKKQNLYFDLGAPLTQ